MATVIASVQKTGRAVVVHEAPRTLGFGAEIVARINEEALLSSKRRFVASPATMSRFPYMPASPPTCRTRRGFYKPSKRPYISNREDGELGHER